MFLDKALAELMLQNVDNVSYIKGMHPEFYKTLVGDGYIVEDDFDEVEAVEQLRLANLRDFLPKVEPLKVDAQLKTIDIMLFGWNIGKAFGKTTFTDCHIYKEGICSYPSVIRKYLPLSVKCHTRNQNAGLSWIKRLHSSNTIRHYPLHPNSPYPFS